MSARNISYRVTWPTCTRYYVTFAEAVTAARNETGTEADIRAGKATEVHRVQLVRDAFERAVNGGGGYEEYEWLRWSATASKLTLGENKVVLPLCGYCGDVHSVEENCPE